MANSDFTYDGIISTGVGYFMPDNTFSASVRRMQTKLIRLYFLSGTADGIFGSKTTQAVQTFQASQNITVNGYGNQVTLTKLNTLSPDTTVEYNGGELTHTEWSSGYTNSSISDIESLARTIYGEDTQYSDGQMAVAKELYNRKTSTRNFGSYASSNPKTWKGIVFSPSQYAVATGPSSDTVNARQPNQYTTQWANCVTLATQLVSGIKPDSILSNQCFHLSSGSAYPSGSLASTRIQIPSGVGNKFFDYQTSL